MTSKLLPMPNPQPGDTKGVGPKALLTREEAMAQLRLKPAFFSKVVSGMVKGLPPLACLRIGRRQLFREDTVNQWILDVEAKSCSPAR